MAPGHTGARLAKLALQFATQNPHIPTTLFSSASAARVIRNLQWHAEPLDTALLREVGRILQPVKDLQWNYDQPVVQARVAAR